MYFKSFKQIFQEMGDALVADGSPATDRRVGALTGALLTACASALSMGWLGLAELYNMFFVNLSTGTSLRRRVIDLGMVPNPGNYATGSVLVFPLDNTVTGTVPVGTLLTGPNGQSFQVQTAVAIGHPFTVVPVTCTTVGVNSNLGAGTVLTPSNISGDRLLFKVGTGLDVAGNVIGDLAFGRDPETDAEIKKRFPDYLVNLSRCTLGAVRRALLDTPGVYNLVLQNAKPVPGWMTISVTSATNDFPASLVTAIQATMDQFAAAGYGYLLKPVTRRAVDVSVAVTATDSTVSPSVIRAQVSAAIKSLTQDLQAGRSIYVEEIVKAGYIDGLSYFRVMTPGDTVAQPQEILAIGTVTVAVSYA
jgi:hypothetical protein